MDPSLLTGRFGSMNSSFQRVTNASPRQRHKRPRPPRASCVSLSQTLGGLHLENFVAWTRFPGATAGRLTLFFLGRHISFTRRMAGRPVVVLLHGTAQQRRDGFCFLSKTSGSFLAWCTEPACDTAKDLPCCTDSMWLRTKRTEEKTDQRDHRQSDAAPAAAAGAALAARFSRFAAGGHGPYHSSVCVRLLRAGFARKSVCCAAARKLWQCTRCLSLATRRSRQP